MPTPGTAFWRDHALQTVPIEARLGSKQRAARPKTPCPAAMSWRRSGLDRCGIRTAGVFRERRRHQSLNNSLIAVFERVWASTVFTITAQ